MKGIKQYSLQTLLALTVFVIVTVVMSAQMLYSYHVVKSERLEQMRSSSYLSLTALQKNIAPLIESYSIHEYEELLQTEMEKSKSEVIIVENAYMQRMMASNTPYVTGKVRLESGELIDFDNSLHSKWVQSIPYQYSGDLTGETGEIIGSISVYRSDRVLETELNQLVKNDLINGAVVIIILIAGLYYFIQRIVLNPMIKVLSVMSQVDKFGLPEKHIPSSSSPAIAPLVSAINNMIITIRESQNELDRQHSQRLIFDQVVQHTQGGIMVTDANKCITYVNPAFCTITGYSADEVVGNSPSILSSGQHDQFFYQTLWQAINQQGYWQGEIWNRNKQGEIYIELLMISSLRNNDGDVINYIGIFSDITKSKALFEELYFAKEHLEERIKQKTSELHEAKEHAETANKEKSKFLANMSHELRTPLHGILSFAQFGLKRHTTVGPEKLEAYFSNIKTSGERLLLLLNDLLDLSKLEAGKMELDIALHDLRLTAKECVTEQSAKIEEKGLTLSWHGETIDTLADYDASKIAQVINNILSNAIKFTPEGKGLTILFSDSPYDNMPAITLTLSDEGVGIPDGELESVFNAFIQSSKTDTGAGGTGLGLAICKEIVVQHGGKIWAENNSDLGSSLSFVLPRSYNEDNREASE